MLCRTPNFLKLAIFSSEKHYRNVKNIIKTLANTEENMCTYKAILFSALVLDFWYCHLSAHFQENQILQ